MVRDRPVTETPPGDGNAPSIASIEEAIADIRDGRMVILVDDEDRENEGDLVVAAECVTAEHVNFMAREGRGLICLAVDAPRADALDLQPMARQNTAPLGTAFTASIDKKEGGGLGARGRVATMRHVLDPSARRDDFVTPGHVFPLRARPGGVLVRSGQTEGSVDLARLAGLEAAGVICEIMRGDGTMARLTELLAFGELHNIKVVTVADLIRYRLQHERLVECVGTAQLPTEFGEFTLRCYQNVLSQQVHLALTMGPLGGDESTLVRVHRSDVIPDVFGLDFIPSRSRLAWSLQKMADEGSGVLLYLRPEGGRERLADRIGRYSAMAHGQSPSKKPSTMGFHDFGVGAQILGDLGLHRIRVITDNPRVFKGLSGFGLEITDWVSIRDAAAEG
jgi:3,4-dihydroxy 2-butanone 4-phosphate synthase/GTP cyclohydrolase II